MLQISSFAVLERGTAPSAFGRVWRAAKKSVLKKKDPFTGRIRELPTWTQDLEKSQSGAIAQSRAEVRLDDDKEWTQFKEKLQSRKRPLSDGMIIELWISLIGPGRALSLWQPSWIADDASELFLFPDEVTSGLVNGGVERERLAVRWAEQPYISDAADEKALQMAGFLLALLSPLASTVVDHDAQLAALGFPDVRAW
jgi:hypothetical protein